MLPVASRALLPPLNVQSLTTSNECGQSLTNPSGLMPEQSFVHQAIPLRCEEPQHQPAAPTPINTRESVTFPNVKGLNQLQIQVPEIGLTTTDPSPLIMGMPISHLGYKSQPPPWLGLIQQGNSQVSPSICWQSQPVSLQLKSGDQGPVGPSDSDTGLSHTLCLSSQNPFRRPCHTTLTSHQRIRPCCRKRFIPCWRSRSPSPNKGLLLQHIHSTKKKWWPETSYQPKKARLRREVRTLQDGDSPYSEIPSPKGRLDDQGRLERYLLYLPIAKQFHTALYLLENLGFVINNKKYLC